MADFTKNGDSVIIVWKVISSEDDMKKIVDDIKAVVGSGGSVNLDQCERLNMGMIASFQYLLVLIT